MAVTDLQAVSQVRFQWPHHGEFLHVAESVLVTRHSKAPLLL